MTIAENESTQFSIQDYMKKLLEELTHDMNGIAKTLATNHLFNLNDKTKISTEEKSQLVYHLVA